MWTSRIGKSNLYWERTTMAVGFGKRVRRAQWLSGSEYEETSRDNGKVLYLDRGLGYTSKYIWQISAHSSRFVQCFVCKFYNTWKKHKQILSPVNDRNAEAFRVTVQMHGVSFEMQKRKKGNQRMDG